MTRNSRTSPRNASGFPGQFAPEPDEDDLPKSKSQKKRDMLALQDLGVELEALPRDRLARVPMPEALADAIRDARRITNHEGKRRQMQFVGKVMRKLDDAEVEAIQRVLEAFKGASKAETARLHLVERWRELLLADDAALTKFLAEHPATDVQALRNIIRNARKEREMNKPPRYFRELFQAVKNVLDGTRAAAGEDEAADAGAHGAADANDD